MSYLQKNRNSRISTESDIMDAAEELFAVHGFDGVSNKQLAAKAGLTIGALYHYFVSKEALYKNVKERIFQRKSMLPDSFLKSDEIPEKKLKWLVSWFINNLVSDKNFGLLIQREFISPSSDKSELLIAQYFKKPHEIFRDLLKDLLPNANQDAAFTSLLALCFGYANLKGMYNSELTLVKELNSADDIASHVTHLLLNGMSCPPDNFHK